MIVTEAVPPSTSSRPRLLFLAHTLPYPLDGGVWLRTFNILRQLALAYDIDALLFERAVPGGQSRVEVAEAETALSSHCSVRTFQLSETRSRLGKLEVHLRSVLHSRVFTYFRHNSPAFLEAVRALVASNRYSVAHVDSLDLSAALPLLQSLPVCCTHHNVESDLLRQRAVRERGAFAAYVRYQARLQLAEERRWVPRVALNVMVSEADRLRLLDVASHGRFAVVPNGVDTNFFRVAAVPTNRRLVFVGGFGWHPNRDAFFFFAQSILPRLRARITGIEVQWIGGGADREVQQTAESAGIQLMGRVDDIRPIVSSARCFIAPLRIGGGSRLKLLDAWALGRPIVSTKVGCDGLLARHGENLLIADSPDDFATDVCRILNDDTLAKSLSESGRALSEREYEWSRIGERLREAYHLASRTLASS